IIGTPSPLSVAGGAAPAQLPLASTKSAAVTGGSVLSWKFAPDVRRNSADASGARNDSVSGSAQAPTPSASASATSIDVLAANRTATPRIPPPPRRTQDQLCVTIWAAATVNGLPPQALLTQRPCSSGCQ